MDAVPGKDPHDERKDNGKASPWKTVAVFAGISLQLVVSIVVFGYLGHLLAVRTHHAWITGVGALFGIVVGASGLAFLVKQILGDKS